MARSYYDSGTDEPGLLGWTSVSESRDMLHWTLDREPYVVWETTTTAVVEIAQEYPHIVLDVTLQRLVEPDNAGLWFVTDAHVDQGILLNKAGTIDQSFDTNVSSPIQVGGVGGLSDGQTTVTLLDHTLTLIGENSVQVQDNSTFTSVLPYAQPERSEPGVLIIESLPQPENVGIESGQVRLTSVLLN